MSEPENPACAFGGGLEPMSDGVFEKILAADSWSAACALAHRSGGYAWPDVADKLIERERSYRWATRLAFWRRIKFT